jgi:hypothetical protein
MNNVYLPLTITGWRSGSNWLMTFADATISIGVFTNNRATFDAGVAYWRQKVPATIYMPSDGPTPIPVHPDFDTAAELKTLWYNPSSYVAGLEGETGRDLGHTAMGLGSMAAAAETAKIQGVDLYGEQRDRLVAGFELNAGFVRQYWQEWDRLGGRAPAADWRPTGWVNADFLVGGTAFEGGWEVAYNYYAKRLGISMPNTKWVIDRNRPSGVTIQNTFETLTNAR